MIKKWIYIGARFIAAFVMLQTLYFKFTGSPESVYIFTQVGMEPVGRWLVGGLELLASIFLLLPTFAWLGGILGAALMLGAVGMHLTLLGIEVMDDGGYLFGLALVVLICSILVLVFNKQKIQEDVIGKFFKK